MLGIISSKDLVSFSQNTSIKQIKSTLYPFALAALSKMPNLSNSRAIPVAIIAGVCVLSSYVSNFIMADFHRTFESRKDFSDLKKLVRALLLTTTWASVGYGVEKMGMFLVHKAIEKSPELRKIEHRIVFVFKILQAASISYGIRKAGRVGNAEIENFLQDQRRQIIDQEAQRAQQEAQRAQQEAQRAEERAQQEAQFAEKAMSRIQMRLAREIQTRRAASYDRVNAAMDGKIVGYKVERPFEISCTFLNAKDVLSYTATSREKNAAAIRRDILKAHISRHLQTNSSTGVLHQILHLAIDLKIPVSVINEDQVPGCKKEGIVLVKTKTNQTVYVLLFVQLHLGGGSRESLVKFIIMQKQGSSDHFSKVKMKPQELDSLSSDKLASTLESVSVSRESFRFSDIESILKKEHPDFSPVTVFEDAPSESGASAGVVNGEPQPTSASFNEAERVQEAERAERIDAPNLQLWQVIQPKWGAVCRLMRRSQPEQLRDFEAQYNALNQKIKSSGESSVDQREIVAFSTQIETMLASLTGKSGVTFAQ